MDEHLEKLGVARGRILETVWYIGYSGTKKQLLDHIKSILGKEDLLIVVEAKSATWTKLLVDDKSLVEAWSANANDNMKVQVAIAQAGTPPELQEANLEGSLQQ